MLSFFHCGFLQERQWNARGASLLDSSNSAIKDCEQKHVEKVEATLRLTSFAFLRIRERFEREKRDESGKADVGDESQSIVRLTQVCYRLELNEDL